MKIKEALINHHTYYPHATLRDFFKFLYQSEFGPGHLIKNKEENLKFLMREYESLETNASKLIDPLGNEFGRMNLHILNNTTLSIHTFQRFFEISAATLDGTVNNYFEKINILRQLIIHKHLPFDIDEFEEFFKQVQEKPKNPIHHSQTFRDHYQPAYRVVKQEFHTLLSLFCNIDALLDEFEQVIIAIDGDCGAGKTTVAKLLAKVYDCNIIHMDDFFLQPHQITPERLETPGENIDHERFLDSVILPLKTGTTFHYCPYNCQSKTFTTPITITPKQLTIIEGSYSHHPNLSKFYDSKIFIKADKLVQIPRLKARNSRELLEKFKTTWIPMEKKYQKAFNIEDEADVVYNNVSI